MALMNRISFSARLRFESLYRSSDKRNGVMRLQSRRLRYEQLEIRSMMASDVASCLDPSNADIDHSEHDHGYFPDTYGQAEETNPTHWVMSLDEASVANILSIVSPAVLGVFTPQTIGFRR